MKSLFCKVYQNVSSLVVHDQQALIVYLSFLGLATNQNYSAEKLTFKEGTTGPPEYVTAIQSTCLHEEQIAAICTTMTEKYCLLKSSKRSTLLQKIVIF